MMIKFSSIIGVWAISLAASATALAQNNEFQGATELNLHDFVANIEINATDTDKINVSIRDTSKGTEPVLVRQKGKTVEIYSTKKPDSKKFWRKMNWKLDGNKAFTNYMSDYPTVTISVPKGTDIILDGLISQLDIGDIDSAFTIDSSIYMNGTVGDLRSADIHITGGGDITFGQVTEDITGRISGSGSLDFVSAQSAEFKIMGSGDIAIENITQRASATIKGSGDIDIGTIGQIFDIDIAGSGDITAGQIGGGADISIRGSGGVELERINGPVDVAILGNGDIDIKQGRASQLDVSISGSGDFSFDGIAVNPSVSVHGSGDIYIRDYEGKVKARGDGDIHIGDIIID
ncbi:MAG: GIN domain-containing protein [bacterium]